MNNNKGIAIALGAGAALIALWMIMRFVVLSQYGMSGSWMFFGLPFGGIGLIVLLLRLGLFNVGQRSGGTITHWPQNSGVQIPAPSVPQRLQELDYMRASGTISDAEYNSRRQQIIASI